MNSKQKFMIGLVFLTLLNVGILQQWQISNLSNQLDISDVADGISKRLIYRHPHVYNKTEKN